MAAWPRVGVAVSDGKGAIFFFILTAPNESKRRGAQRGGATPRPNKNHRPPGAPQIVSARATDASGTEPSNGFRDCRNEPMNHFMFYQGKLLGLTDDGLMAYSSLVFGLFAAYQWRREARIAAWIAFRAGRDLVPRAYLQPRLDAYLARPDRRRVARQWSSSSAGCAPSPPVPPRRSRAALGDVRRSSTAI